LELRLRRQESERDRAGVNEIFEVELLELGPTVSPANTPTATLGVKEFAEALTAAGSPPDPQGRRQGHQGNEQRGAQRLLRQLVGGRKEVEAADQARPNQGLMTADLLRQPGGFAGFVVAVNPCRRTTLPSRHVQSDTVRISIAAPLRLAIGRCRAKVRTWLPGPLIQLFAITLPPGRARAGERWIALWRPG
jgi:hypothetical protein